MTTAVFIGLFVVFLTQFNFPKPTTVLNSNIKTAEISEDTAITRVRTLPEVQEFIAAVEDKYKDNRHVSFQVDEADNKEYFSVIVAETDDIKKTTWKIFQVKKDGSEILVINSVTGELEPIIEKTKIAPKKANKITVPADFSVRYDVSGGMLPTGSTLTVTTTGALYEEYGAEGFHDEKYFALNSSKIEALYQALQTNKFSTIKTRKEMVYDRGGDSITYTANGTTITKSSGGTSFIEAGDSQKRYQAIVDMLGELTQ